MHRGRWRSICAYAALHNAGLKATFEDWRAALEQIPQAKALPDPEVHL